MNLISAFVCGLIFSLGLGMAGMTQPTKIIAFLDVAGSWDPSLLFVMAGAVSLGLVLFPSVLKRRAPILGTKFLMPEKAGVDTRLLTGSALFGIGWGLSGLCPGPALVSLVTAQPAVFVFVSSMIAGLGIGRFWSNQVKSGS